MKPCKLPNVCVGAAHAQKNNNQALNNHESTIQNGKLQIYKCKAQSIFESSLLYLCQGIWNQRKPCTVVSHKRLRQWIPGMSGLSNISLRMSASVSNARAEQHSTCTMSFKVRRPPHATCFASFHGCMPNVARQSARVTNTRQDETHNPTLASPRIHLMIWCVS